MSRSPKKCRMHYLGFMCTFLRHFSALILMGDCSSWEWATSIRFEYEFIEGKRKLRWPLVSIYVLYMLALCSLRADVHLRKDVLPSEPIFLLPIRYAVRQKLFSIACFNYEICSRTVHYNLPK